MTLQLFFALKAVALFQHMSLKNPQPFLAFLDYLKFEKRYSPHTITSYQTDLIAFLITCSLLIVRCLLINCLICIYEAGWLI